MRTIEFIDAVKRLHDLSSDYAAAQRLGVTRQVISRYRKGIDFLGDDTALKVADLLGLDAGFVLACAHAERAASESTRAAWRQVAETLQKAGLGALLLASSLISVSPAPVQAATVQGEGLCITSNRRRRLLLRSLAHCRRLRPTQSPEWMTPGPSVA